MISDEPDEDADFLDDESLVAAPDERGPPAQAARTSLTPPPSAWPPRRWPDGAPNSDAATLAWFKVRYPNWRAGVPPVLHSPAGRHMPVRQDQESPEHAAPERHSSD